MDRSVLPGPGPSQAQRERALSRHARRRRTVSHLSQLVAQLLCLAFVGWFGWAAIRSGQATAGLGRLGRAIKERTVGLREGHAALLDAVERRTQGNRRYIVIDPRERL